MSLIVRKEDFQLSGGPLKTFTRTSDSGRSVTCAFCQDCGTRIFHQPQYLDGVVNVKPGTLDDTTALRPTMEVWTKEKQRWITWSLDVTSFEGQPI